MKLYDRSAFTLIELIFVLLIIAAVMTVAAPTLRGFAHGSRLRDVATEFVATTQLARLNAATTATTHRISHEEVYGWGLMAMEGDAFVAVDLLDAHPTQPLPEGYRIEITDLNGAPLDAIEFYPTGRSTPARIRITNSDGRYIEIEAVTPTDAFHMIQQGGTR